MRRSWHLILTAALLLGTATGCGGGRDKGRNSDHDRPRHTEKR